MAYINAIWRKEIPSVVIDNKNKDRLGLAQFLVLQMNDK